MLTRHTQNGKAVLIAICEAAHTRHYTEYIVVDGIDADLGRQGRRICSQSYTIYRAGGSSLQRVRRQRQVQHGIVNTGEVAGATGLVLLRL